jgi:heterotetrameric sarcosine oxidase delta subunit
LRDLTEFRYGGEAGVDRPENPATASDAEWADYLYYRNNLKGPHVERWVHIHGCRQWFELRRDTLTHEVEPPPEASA